MEQNGFSANESSGIGPSRTAYLISGYIRRTLTQEEHDELDEWVGANDDNMKFFEELTDENNIAANLELLDKLNTEKALQRVKENITFTKKDKPTLRWWRWPAAAIVIIALGTALYLENKNHPAPFKPTEIVQDVQPGGNRATLVLSDGTILDLDSAKNGLLQNDNGTAVIKKNDGELSYSGKDSVADLYNILTTPKGGQYTITLSDGTKVWLNAESSLKYPLNFSGKERRVEINGEGYFEVAHDLTKPFIVKKDSTEVTVLGTHFNVNAYEDEPSMKITLLEGSVKVSQLITHNSKLLTPGEQAVLTLNSKLITLNSPDLDQVIAWKNGQFVFHDEQVAEIMKQVKRWYDVNIIYQVDSSEHFNATIDRNNPVSKLLHILEETDRIHFKIDKKTIYVLR